jgi:hypothetical protein
MLGNWINQTTATTGTGDLTLSAVTGYPTFADQFSAGANGTPFYYSILNDSDGTPIEVGQGYLSASTTLVRSRVLGTYSAGVYDNTSPATVSLAAGTKRVICTPEAGALAMCAPYVSNNAALALGKRVVSQHVTVNNASSAAVTLVANRLYVVPFLLTSVIELASLIARVGTGVAATNIRLGLYRCGRDGFPSELIAETAALASTTSGVDISGSVTPVRLTPGWYFTGMVSDGAPIVGRLDGGVHLSNPLGQAASNCMVEASNFTATYAFGALPNPCPTTGLAAGAVTACVGVVLGVV